ncbi:MAG TPA: hypothetical protein VM661_01490 [Candidatus Sulfotelmatobacter sp.]|nr:hypothetical protein [Candidatus Sulfotelmatobacter sp.]
MEKWDYRTVLNWVATAVCALWMGVTVYSQFFDVDPNQYGFRSPEIEQKMKNCSGSFEQRYKCKEALIIEKGHDSFLIWISKMALVFGPPAILLALVRVAVRQRENDDIDTFNPPPPASIKKRKVR